MLSFRVFSCSVDIETMKAASQLICHAFLAFLENSFCLWNHPHPAPWQAKRRICPLWNISLWKKAGTALLAPLYPLHPLPLCSLPPRCVCCHCTAVYASRGSPCWFQYSFLFPAQRGVGTLLRSVSWAGQWLFVNTHMHCAGPAGPQVLLLQLHVAWAARVGVPPFVVVILAIPLWTCTVWLMRLLLAQQLQEASKLSYQNETFSENEVKTFSWERCSSS